MTGANKGIGLAIVKKLLAVVPDSHLYLGSRDVERGERAVQEVVEELGQDVANRLEMIQLGVCSDLSVEAAVASLKTRLGEGVRLYGLVNNAGGILSDARETIQLNTYGPIRVCQAFIPLLQSDQGDEIMEKYTSNHHSFDFQAGLFRFPQLRGQTLFPTAGKTSRMSWSVPTSPSVRPRRRS